MKKAPKKGGGSVNVHSVQTQGGDNVDHNCGCDDRPGESNGYSVNYDPKRSDLKPRSPSGNVSNRFLGPCPVKCDRKVHPGGSLQYCEVFKPKD